MTTTKEKQALMDKHGITSEIKLIYKYKNFKYDQLDQALNYALIDQKKVK